MGKRCLQKEERLHATMKISWNDDHYREKGIREKEIETNCASPIL